MFRHISFLKPKSVVSFFNKLSMLDTTSSNVSTLRFYSAALSSTPSAVLCRFLSCRHACRLFVSCSDFTCEVVMHACMPYSAACFTSQFVWFSKVHRQSKAASLPPISFLCANLSSISAAIMTSSSFTRLYC
jgi:hypothetical protein